MCISLARRFIVPRGLHIRLGTEIMVWDGRHHLCTVHVVNDMQYAVFICCNVRCVDFFLFFFEHVVLRSCTASCRTSSIFVSQMAVGFWNAIRTDVSFGVFIINAKGIFFFLLSCFKQCVLGLSGLPGLNAVIIFPFYCNAIIAWRCFSFFFLVSQAFTTMLAKRGTVLCVDVLGTTLMVC